MGIIIIGFLPIHATVLWSDRRVSVAVRLRRVNWKGGGRFGSGVGTGVLGIYRQGLRWVLGFGRDGWIVVL